MRRKQLAKDKGDLVSIPEQNQYASYDEKTNEDGPHFNNTLSSENPAARASTAEGVPMFRNANIAR